VAKAIITITGDTVFPEGIDIGVYFGNISFAKIIQNAGKLNAGKLNTIVTRYASRSFQQRYYLMRSFPIKEKISTMKMHRYVKQLLEDLETAAANPPASPCIDFPHDFEVDPWISELALSPFKPISEWDGLDSALFPPRRLLTARQMTMLFNAMVKVLDSLNIELFLPENFPKNRKYSSLVLEWETPVQYLPHSGYDLSLCKDSWETCPHRKYCICPDVEDLFFDQDAAGEESSDDENIGCPF
jgi:hypothetical protein